MARTPTHPSPQAYFGAAVRRRREALGYSQERLAELAGIHRNYAGAVERGERNVALLNMVRLARALGVPLAELVDGIDATPQAKAANAGPADAPRPPKRRR